MAQTFQIINYLLFHLYFPILWLVFFYRWLHKKNVDKIFKISWISYISIVVIMVSWGTWLLYQGWSNSPIYSFLLPPNSNYLYLLTFKTLLFHIISIALGIVFYFLLKVVVKLTKVKFIELFEIKLLALGAILAGWSNIIMYLGITLILMLFSSVFINLFKISRGQRISLAPYVFLSLILTLLIGYKFSSYLGLY